MVESCSTLPSLFVFADFSSSRIWRWTMFWKNDKTKRADYTKHQKSAGAWLSLQSDVLCNRLWKSKSGSASYSSCQQNQWRGGAVRYFRCTDTVSDETDSHKICLNISIFSFGVDKLSTTLLYKQRPQLSRFPEEMLARVVVSFYKIRRPTFYGWSPWSLSIIQFLK